MEAATAGAGGPGRGTREGDGAPAIGNERGAADAGREPVARESTGRRLARLTAALVSGAVLALAYPTWDVEAVVWFWMFPLLAALWLGNAGHIGKWRVFGMGWLAGFACHFLVLRWLSEIHGGGLVLSGLSWVCLPAYLACYTGVWAVFASGPGRLHGDRVAPPADGLQGGAERRQPFPGLMPNGAGSLLAPGLHVAGVAATNAAAWAGLEWLRGWLLGGFGWNGLGVALHANPAMIQVAEFTGVSGLSFLPVFVSVCLFGTAWRIQRRMAVGVKTRALNVDFALAMLLVVAVFIFGTLRLAQRDGTTRTLQVVVVQRNIPQDTKWDPSLALEHTRGYLDAFDGAMQQRESDRMRHIEDTLTSSGEVAVNLAPPDVVLLPESALPFYLNDPIVAEFRARLLDMAGPGTVLVTGINDAEPGEKPRFFNSIAVLDGQDTPPLVYRKINLVPFGEYLPLRWFPPMEWLAGAAVPGDFEPGTSAEPLELATRNGHVGLIPMICFEDSLGRHARRFVRVDKPQILVNTTNDGWFPHPAAALQHAANAKFRCVELRRPMVRAANTGLSCAIDQRGMVLDSIRDARTGSAQTAGVMMVDLPVEEYPELTFFARFGDLFSWTCGAVALLVAFSSRIQAKKRRALSTARTSCPTSSSVL